MVTAFFEPSANFCCEYFFSNWREAEGAVRRLLASKWRITREFIINFIAKQTISY